MPGMPELSGIGVLGSYSIYKKTHAQLISIILVAAVGKNFTVKQRSKISSHCEHTPDWLVN